MNPEDKKPVNRRQFLTGAAALTGYSLLVKAPQSLSAQEELFVVRDEVSPRIDELAPDGAKKGLVATEPNMRTVELESDVFVAGGGLAGVCAALSAARHGSRVVLVQDRSRLGGNASSEIKMHPLGSQFGFREGGIIEELCLENAYNNEQNAWEIWDLMLYDKVIRESRIKLLLDTSLYRAEMKGNEISSVWARCDKTEMLYHIRSHIYIDATGDARLGLETGAEFRLGRESSADFGESLADYDPPGTTQGSSILFTARKHSRPIAYQAPTWARHITEADLFGRSVSTSWNYGYWWIELGGVYDTIKDNERLRFELLAIVLGVWDHIKNSGRYPDSENWALETVGMIPGKRESRRLMGDEILNQHHIQGKWKAFPDSVAFGGWTMDDHPALGFDARDRKPYLPTRAPEAYNIPLGTLYSKNVANLMMAGRNISATHVGFSSTRVMKTCAVIGQAAGTAAHMCCQDKILPRGLRESSAKVKTLQQMLLRDGAMIMSAKNEDPADLAPKATLRASGSLYGSKPENVVSGVTYNTREDYSHRWVAPFENGRAELRLEWNEPHEISEVQIIHDTGLHRSLTMSVHENQVKNTVFGPQPETCRDYRVTGIRPDGEEVPLAMASNNYQRLRRHTFEPIKLRVVKITLTRPNGENEAGIYEVRVY